MKTIAFSISAVCILFLSSSCERELELFSPQYSNVDQALWKYYEDFEKEAELRGFSFDLNNLEVSGEISQIHDSGVAGTCQFGSAINNHVTIDQTFWNRSSELSREFVVFHELGHCALLRGHDESSNQNGLCLSIMRSGLGDCRDAYSTQNREAYLNELFYESD